MVYQKPFLTLSHSSKELTTTKNKVASLQVHFVNCNNSPLYRVSASRAQLKVNQLSCWFISYLYLSVLFNNLLWVECGLASWDRQEGGGHGERERGAGTVIGLGLRM